MCAYFLSRRKKFYLFSLHVVNKESEHFVQDEPGAVGIAQIEGLSERVSRIVVSLELTDHVDQYALFHGDLCVDGRSESIHFLKRQTLKK